MSNRIGVQNRLQRKCACGGTPGPTGECVECRKKRLQRKGQRSNETRSDSSVPPIVDEVLRSSGRPLDLRTRAFFESRFGHDFSKVRIHFNSAANQSAGLVNALAYTVGQDVVFGPGQYAPSTTAGQKLIAHELAHTIQQGCTSTSKGTIKSLRGQDQEQDKPRDPRFGTALNVTLERD